MRSLRPGLLAPAVLAVVLALIACRGGACVPRDVQIPVFTPTPAPQRCFNDRYPGDAPQFEADQFDYRELPGGLMLADLAAGTGVTPASDGAVSVRFTGFLPDGCVFTTSFLQADPVVIDLTESIAGIQEGVSTMQVGGVRRLRIPADLAYGARGVPGRVPAGSTVIFVIDLKGIVDLSATGTPPDSATGTPPLPQLPDSPGPEAAP